MVGDTLVLGSGTAGLLAALALKQFFPQMVVRILRSPALGIIGVGEGSTSDLPNHLHGFLKIDPAEFLVQARPTWKLGVHFLWGPRPHFDYTFSSTVTARLAGVNQTSGFYGWEDLTNLDPQSALMEQGRAFGRLENGAPHLPNTLAYHIENADFVAYLEKLAVARGVKIIDGTVAQAEPGPLGIAALILDTGEKLSADLYVDASGFRSELLGRALGEQYTSYDDSLFCDRAIAGGWERTTEPILPYTVAETMDAGWAWQIEHERHINRGYVYSSAFISDEAADAEFRRKNPKVTKSRVVKFPTGRYARSWVGNVVAVGNSSGFVEPLEATAILMICHATRFLVGGLFDSGCAPTPTVRTAFNTLMGKVWDEIRDFLAIHYRFNTRCDTPFWRECRERVALHGAEPIVEYYRENGPSQLLNLGVLVPESSVFRLDGFYTLLLGQKVPHRRMQESTPQELAVVQEHRHHFARVAKQGFNIAQGLELIRSPRWTWTPGFYK